VAVARVLVGCSRISGREREIAEEAWPGDIIGVPNHGQLRVGEFYATSEALTFEKIRTPLCLSHHPASPLTEEEVIARARAT